MFVIGTSGHVDHGKSTLVRALTGIDPDRLAEEKSRGMTIELGFAWLKLPDGTEASVVDVPGHERFIKNMLMGVGGIDLALLIVAADEGIMPQTREHLAVLDLLQVSHAIAVITKRDLVDDDWLALVTAEVEAVLKGTSLAGSPVVAVSAQNGDGLGRLIEVISQSLAALPPRRDIGRPRLPVDRSFSIAGFGAVVTGTLIGGTLKPGDEVVVLPGGQRARIRGIQTHRHAVPAASPGTRVAVNLSGIEHHEVQRGDVLTRPGWLTPTSTVDVSLRAIRGAPRPMRHNQPVSVHLLTIEAPATVRLLDADQLKPGETGPAQLRLERAIPAVRGDRFIIRDSDDTLGGGVVLEVDARRHKRFDQPTLDRLNALEHGTPDESLTGAVEKLQPVSAAVLARAVGLQEVEVALTAARLAAAGQLIRLGEGNASLYLTPHGWQSLADRATKGMAAYHEAYPLRPGMPREELRNRLGLAAAAFNQVARELGERAIALATDSWLRLPQHTPRFTPDQQRAADAYIALLASDPYSPPTGSAPDAEVVQALAESGAVVKAGDDIVFTKAAFDEMLEKTRSLANEQGQITIQGVRELFGTSRKYTLAFLEQLDRMQVTRRNGDIRSLR